MNLHTADHTSFRTAKNCCENCSDGAAATALFSGNPVWAATALFSEDPVWAAATAASCRMCRSPKTRVRRFPPTRPMTNGGWKTRGFPRLRHFLLCFRFLRLFPFQSSDLSTSRLT